MRPYWKGYLKLALGSRARSHCTPPARAQTRGGPLGSFTQTRGNSPAVERAGSTESLGLSRCAIYTRKSTEHNLDLAFTSLDAQREACEAYITSQAGEGWRLVAEPL